MGGGGGGGEGRRRAAPDLKFSGLKELVNTQKNTPASLPLPLHGRHKYGSPVGLTLPGSTPSFFCCRKKNTPPPHPRPPPPLRPHPPAQLQAMFQTRCPLPFLALAVPTLPTFHRGNPMRSSFRSGFGSPPPPPPTTNRAHPTPTQPTHVASPRHSACLQRGRQGPNERYHGRHTCPLRRPWALQLCRRLGTHRAPPCGLPGGHPRRGGRFGA